MNQQLTEQEQKVETPQVFICYAHEDLDLAQQIYDDLERAGVSLWLDRKNLLPGQNWKQEIKQAMQSSSHILILLSKHSVEKSGYVQKEQRDALDLLNCMPPSKVFLIPVRLDDCEPEHERLQDLHWVSLFDSYEKGLESILRALLPDLQEIEWTQEEVDLETRLGWKASSTHPNNALLEPQDDGNDFEHVVNAPVKIIQPRTARTPLRRIEQSQTSEPQKISESSVIVQRSEPLEASKKVGVIPLRSEPRPLSKGEVDELKEQYRGGQNEFEDQGKIIVDRATGLTWQKSHSKKRLSYMQAHEYAKTLNRDKFAGHNDWRLPTLPELLSLLKPEKQLNRLYINPIFETPDKFLAWYWSADMIAGSSRLAWHVNFFSGGVGKLNIQTSHYVWCVRSTYQEAQKPLHSPQAEATQQESQLIQKRTFKKVGVIPLRSEPRPLLRKEAQEVEKQYWGLQNDFEDRGDVIVDYVTGLMWQKSGSEKALSYKKAHEYAKILNQNKFAGYNDWRLPTLPELLSVLEPEEQSNGLYIGPIFDKNQRWCWSADTVAGSSDSAWYIYFHNDFVHMNFIKFKHYVRVVRSMTDNE